ncbi:MAG: YeeE/YedE family protein [Casimicrobium sp.]
MLSFLSSFVGGLLIGVAVWIVLASVGRVAGVSGIVASAMTERRGRDWRWAFIAGLVFGGAFFTWYLDAYAEVRRAPWLLISAGALVGIGTVIGSGCTSGHGVCGLARGSLRSLVATLTFMATGVAVVALLRAMVV